MEESLPPLHHAAAIGDQKDLTNLIENGADVDEISDSGFTPLYIACQAGCKGAVELLLQHGASVNFNSEDFGTAMFAASKNGHLDIVKCLLHRGADVGIKCGIADETACCLAAEHGHLEILQCILEYDTSTPKFKILLAAAKGHSDNAACIDFLLNDSECDVNATDQASGTTPLIEACTKGSPANVRALALTADLERADAKGRRPLNQAVYRGKIKAAKILLDNGAYVNATCTQFKRTAIFSVGCREGVSNADAKACMQLLMERGALVDLLDRDEKSPLHSITMNTEQDQFELIDLLLQYGCSINHQDSYGATALYYASKYNFVGSLQALIRGGADVDIAEFSYDNTPLHAAAFEGKIENVRVLLRNGACINRRFGQNALHSVMVNFDNQLCFEALLAAGCNINQNSEHGTPLHSAAFFGRAEHLEVLLQKGADISVLNKGQSALHSAVRAHIENNQLCIEALLEAGCNIDQDSTYGTPLHIAAFLGRAEHLKVLLDNGAKIDVLSNQGKSALHDSARRENNSQCINILLNAGCDIDACSSYGTALHMSARTGCVDNVKCLLDSGADYNVRDRYGRKPQDVAARSPNHNVLEVLRQA